MAVCAACAHPASTPRAVVSIDQGVPPAPVAERKAVRPLIDMLFKLVSGDVPERFVPAMDSLHAQALAMVGREDRIAPSRLPACEPLQRDGKNVDALAYVVDEARIARVVIVNEAHDSPPDRAFVRDLVAALQPLGFTNYAAEAFSPEVTANSSRCGCALRSDGLYTNEPSFGEAVTLARELHYTLNAYEMTEAQGAGTSAGSREREDAREEAQASNLAVQLSLLPSSARLLVHVGYSHGEESPRVDRGGGAPREMMALRLKEKTGLDPLTVDQVSFRSTDESRSICRCGPGCATLDAAFDIHVMKPALRFERKRPTWRVHLGEHLVEVPRDAERSVRIIVEARRAEDPIDSVPVDRLLLDPGEDVPLLLPRGRFSLRVCPESGDCHPASDVTVD
jgi:hypothetical protein